MTLINTPEEIQHAKLVSAVEKLRALLNEPDKIKNRSQKVYRFAVARRFTVCYFAFISYLIFRIETSNEMPDSLGIDDVLRYLRPYALLNSSDERTVIKMSTLYTALIYYEVGYEVDDDMMSKVPDICDFLERFVNQCTQVYNNGHETNALL